MVPACTLAPSLHKCFRMRGMERVPTQEFLGGALSVPPRMCLSWMATREMIGSSYKLENFTRWDDRPGCLTTRDSTCLFCIRCGTAFQECFAFWVLAIGLAGLDTFASPRAYAGTQGNLNYNRQSWPTKTWSIGISSCTSIRIPVSTYNMCIHIRPAYATLPP